uniref:B-cell receptor CD22-like n=1 Tax=Xiphophorus maculatus TaxID=8083 RepID=A0A3B5QLW0_XIPMA
MFFYIYTEGVWSGRWGVTYENQCALRGTSVDLKCKYGYTSGNLVTRVSWSKAQQVSNGWVQVPLSQLPSLPNHFTYIGDYHGNCDLRINNVQPSDQGAYYFKFTLKGLMCFSVSVAELTTVVEPSIAREGDAVKMTCMSGCPETKKISWFKDGRLVWRPQFQARREDAGSYYCAIQGEETVRSASVALTVHYQPTNVSVSVNPEHIVAGSGVNLTCVSDANPAADNYTWYKRAEPTDSHSQVHVGSGQVLSLHSMESSHSGLYVCYVRNSLGEGNSTEVVLAMAAGQNGLWHSSFTATFLWFIRQTHLVSRLHGRASNPEEPTETVYSNIHMPPSSPPPASDPYSPPASRGKNVNMFACVYK